MLRNLFSGIFQSMHAAPSLPSPPPEFPRSPPSQFPGSPPPPPPQSWLSLPTDLLLDIFLRLVEPADDVIRCAAVCKPWRRAIIGNAASLRCRRARPDPRLFLGVFHFGRYQPRLQRAPPPGPFQSALPSNVVGRLGGYETARSLIPDAAAGDDDRGLYIELLWSADGFVLLIARTVNRLCLFNPVTGDCTFLPAADASRCSAYVLLTGYADASAPAGAGAGDKLAVRILAVQKRHRFMFSSNEQEEEQAGLSYQVLFVSGAGAGVWGPVQRSGAGEVEAEHGGGLCLWMERRGTVVCGDAVHWLAGPSAGTSSITCTLALDESTCALAGHGRRRCRRLTASTPAPILAASPCRSWQRPAMAGGCL